MVPRVKTHRSAKYRKPTIRRAVVDPQVDPLAGKLVVRLKDAFELIGCGHSKGYELINDGRLKVVKIDRMTLAYVHSIRELLGLSAAQAHPPAPAAATTGL